MGDSSGRARRTPSRKALNGSGEIATVINGTGPASTSSTDGTPEDVTNNN